MSKIFAPVAFCLAMAAGYYVSVSAFGGVAYVYMGERRAPAAVRALSDYTAVDRQRLFSSLQKQILSEAKLARDTASVQLTLGHPFMRGPGGNDFACPVAGRPGLFDRVELTFLGTGISMSGEQARMIVEAPCVPGDKLGELAPIAIPMRDIVTSEAKDQELQLYGDQPVTVRLEDIPGEWPTGWVLWNVRMFRAANPEESLSIDSNLIREVNPKLLSFDWK